MATRDNSSDETDAWKAYLSTWEKSDYALWKAVGDFTSVTTFIGCGAFIISGLPLLLRRIMTLLSGMEEPRTSVTNLASQAFLPVVVALVFSIAISSFATRRSDRIETAGRSRKRDHDQVVGVTRAVVQLARLVEPVRANMPLRSL